MVGGFGFEVVEFVLSQEVHEVFLRVLMFGKVPLEGFLNFRLVIGSWTTWWLFWCYLLSEMLCRRYLLVSLVAHQWDLRGSQWGLLVGIRRLLIVPYHLVRWVVGLIIGRWDLCEGIGIGVMNRIIGALGWIHSGGIL